MNRTKKTNKTHLTKLSQGLPVYHPIRGELPGYPGEVPLYIPGISSFPRWWILAAAIDGNRTVPNWILWNLQGLVNVPMFHITQLLGIFHLQQIFVKWWCDVQIPKSWDIYHPTPDLNTKMWCDDSNLHFLSCQLWSAVDSRIQFLAVLPQRTPTVVWLWFLAAQENPILLRQKPFKCVLMPLILITSRCISWRSAYFLVSPWPNGGFLKWGVPPVIIHFQGIFHYKATILGLPPWLWKPPNIFTQFHPKSPLARHLSWSFQSSSQVSSWGNILMVYTLHLWFTIRDVCVKFICLSVCLSVCLHAWMDACICMCTCLSICLSVCLSVCPSVRLSVCPSLCLSVSLSLCLSVCLSVCMHACMHAWMDGCMDVRTYVRMYVCMCCFNPHVCSRLPPMIYPAHVSPVKEKDTQDTCELYHNSKRNRRIVPVR